MEVGELQRWQMLPVLKDSRLQNYNFLFVLFRNIYLSDFAMQTHKGEKGADVRRALRIKVTGHKHWDTKEGENPEGFFFLFWIFLVLKFQKFWKVSCVLYVPNWVYLSPSINA